MRFRHHQVGAIYVPDLCVAPVDRISPGSEPVPAEYVLLAVEITSRGNADNDRKKKHSACANGSIPQYLLVDAFDEDGPAVSLFSDPVKGVYSRFVRFPFGEPIKIGDPFGIELDTTGF